MSGIGARYEPLMTCLEILSVQSRRARGASRLMEILLELVKRLNVDVGGRFAEDGVWERHGEAAQMSTASSGPYTSPELLSSTDNVDSVAQCPTPWHNWLSDSEVDFDNLSMVPELSFDLDPLFGFQGPDMDFGGGFGGF